MLKIYYVSFYLLLSFLSFCGFEFIKHIGCQQAPIVFVKTLDGEKFRTDLVPSLEKNVSYVMAIDLRNSQLVYNLSSDYFSIDPLTGRVYLIAKLAINFLEPITFQMLSLTASNGVDLAGTENRVAIVNANDQPPLFMSTQRVLDIVEDNPAPVEFQYKNNGSFIQIVLSHPDPSNLDLSLSCENTADFPEACDTFSFRKDQTKSSNQIWIGTLVANRRLNYLERSIYQFYAVAQNSMQVSQREVFEVRVLPNLNKAPKLSPSSLLFKVTEKQPAFTLIGEFNLEDGYEKVYLESVSFNIVYNLQELIGNGISLPETWDVNTNLIRNYIELVNNNQLQTTSIIDRDSYEIAAVDGILKFWLKVYYRANQYIANYYKITLIVTDLNDNPPSFGLVFNNTIFNSYHDLNQMTELVSIITENEVGLIYFDNINRTLLETKSIVVYDRDLAENATFSLTFVETQEGAVIKYPLKEINEYFSIVSSYDSNYATETCNSLNIVNTKPIDFDNLDMPILIDSTGIGYKLIKFGVRANDLSETAAQSMGGSNYLPIGLMIQDVNDNKPTFSQDTYLASIDSLINQKDPFSLQKVVQFFVYDKDSGVYGLKGLVCNLMGDGTEKFLVDSLQQIIYLKQCSSASPCRIEDYKKIYYLTLLCRDNAGKGNIAFATIIVSFQGIYRPGFVLSNRIFYLLATGPNNVDIPKLTIKPLKLDPMNKITYKIQDNSMADLFSIDAFGTFRIVAPFLAASDRRSVNGTFLVPISCNDLQGNVNMITVIIQLSTLACQTMCPKIVDSALCQFTINQTSFDSNRIRFCFYGANPPAVNPYQNSSYPFSSQILYSLLPNAPNYLYINPYDGCVKISAGFNFQENSIRNIDYSVGVFNPGYPDCISISQRSCSIIISNPKLPPPTCANFYTISTNNTLFKLQAFTYDHQPNVNYYVIKEDRFMIDGSMETSINPNEFFYLIDRQYGVIELSGRFNSQRYNYTSVLVTVQVVDVNDPSSKTDCLVEFRFSYLFSRNTPKLITSDCPTNICEDYPKGSLVLRLNAFDSSFSGKQLCFSIIGNEYFKLATAIDPTPNGDVILRKRIDYDALKLVAGAFGQISPYLSLNFTALLYYCGQASILDIQSFKVDVYHVNKFPPSVETYMAENFAVISLKEGSNFSTGSMRIIDNDIAPFNAFKCWIENNDQFYVNNVNQERTVSIAYSYYKNSDRQFYRPYVDLSVKCCDDVAYWTVNSCFSIPKCSMTPIRVQLIDYSLPILCVNDQQLNYVPENALLNSEISSVACVSNYTSEVITYQMSSKSSYFTVHPLTGQIILSQSLINCGISMQSLLIKCSNRMQSAQCQLNIRIVPITDYRPVWINPNPNTMNQCIQIAQNTPVGTQIATVQASVPTQLLNDNSLTYSFVYEGQLTNRVYEFEFKSHHSGQIFLRSYLNTSNSAAAGIYGTMREVTLAATASKNNMGQYTMTTYQYFCIVILPPEDCQPCFRRFPDGSIWPYQVNLQETNARCYYDQSVKAANAKNILGNRQIYYYALSLNYTVDNLYGLFNVDPLTGLVCSNTPNNDLLKSAMALSPFTYVDKFNYQCYNLLLITTTSKIGSQADLKNIFYDLNNCSFSYLKICMNNLNSNYWPIVDSNSVYESIFALDSFSAFSSVCLIKFQLTNRLSDKSFYDYHLTPINNPLDTKIFFVNKSIDCLSLKSAAGVNRNALLGLHAINVTVNDKFGRCQTNLAQIYVTQSCDQKSYVITSMDLHLIKKTINLYKHYLAAVASSFLCRPIRVIVHGVYEQPSDTFSYKKLLIEEFHQSTKSIIAVSFFDPKYGRFVNNDEVLAAINSNLYSNPARELDIEQIISSCPVIQSEAILAQAIILALWCLFLLILFVLVPLLVICLLCYLFKKLKYQNNRIIMKEKVIPIMIQEGECEATMGEPQICESQICTISPITTRSQTIMRGSMQQPTSHRIRHGTSNSADEYLDEIIEEPPLSISGGGSSGGNDRYMYKAIDLPREVETALKNQQLSKQQKQQQQQQIFHLESSSLAGMSDTGGGGGGGSRFRSIVLREPIKTVLGDRQNNNNRDYQLYEAVNSRLQNASHHLQQQHQNRSNSSSRMLNETTTIKSSSGNTTLDPALLMEPVGDVGVVSLNADSAAFFYSDDSPVNNSYHNHHHHHQNQLKHQETKRSRREFHPESLI